MQLLLLWFCFTVLCLWWVLKRTHANFSIGWNQKQNRDLLPRVSRDSYVLHAIAFSFYWFTALRRLWNYDRPEKLLWFCLHATQLKTTTDRLQNKTLKIRTDNGAETREVRGTEKWTVPRSSLAIEIPLCEIVKHLLGTKYEETNK